MLDAHGRLHDGAQQRRRHRILWHLVLEESEPMQEPRQEKQKHGPTRRGASKENAGELGQDT